MQYKNRIDLAKIGMELKRRRQESGLSQEAVALEADVAKYAYGRLECGLLEDVRIQTLDRIASFYRMKLSDLLEYGSTDSQKN